MQNCIPNFRQSSVTSKKSGYLLETLKTLAISSYYNVQYMELSQSTLQSTMEFYYWNFAHVSCLKVPVKRCAEIFILFR